MAACARPMSTPGLRRAKIESQPQFRPAWSRRANPPVAAWRHEPTGIQRSSGLANPAPRNPSGAMPMTVNGAPLRRTALPTTAGEEPKRCLPDGVREHDQGFPGLFFRRKEEAPEGRVDAEHVEVVGGDDCAARALGAAGGRQIHRAMGPRGCSREDGAASVAKADVRRVGAAVNGQVHELAGALDAGQRAQDDGVHETEGRRVEPDAEGEDGQRRQREAGAARQRAQRVLQVTHCAALPSG